MLRCKEMHEAVSKAKKLAQFIESYGHVFSVFDNNVADNKPLPDHVLLWLAENLPSLIDQSATLNGYLHALQDAVEEHYGNKTK